MAWQAVPIVPIIIFALWEIGKMINMLVWINVTPEAGTILKDVQRHWSMEEPEPINSVTYTKTNRAMLVKCLDLLGI